MGIFDFVRDAGEKIFGGSEEKEAQKAEELAQMDRAKADALTNTLNGMSMSVDNLGVQFAGGKATVTGTVPSQAEREKVVLLLGNTQGVAQVDDRLVVKEPAPEATMYTVKSGDSLSKIAKQHYGDALKYPVIFEANTPMLKDPNRIYPGQVLRIPVLGK